MTNLLRRSSRTTLKKDTKPDAPRCRMAWGRGLIRSEIAGIVDVSGKHIGQGDERRVRCGCVRDAERALHAERFVRRGAERERDVYRDAAGAVLQQKVPAVALHGPPRERQPEAEVPARRPSPSGEKWA